MAKAKTTKTIKKKKVDLPDELKKAGKKSDEPKIGDEVILKNNHHCLCADFPAGTKVIITEVGRRGYSIKNIDVVIQPDGRELKDFEMMECGFDL